MSKRSRKINEVLEDNSSAPKTPREKLEAMDAEYAAEERALREAAAAAKQAEKPETGRVTKTGKRIRDVESTKRMDFDYPPEDESVAEQATAPKKNGRKKDDYYVFRQILNQKTGAKAWVLASDPMRNVSECDKFVKDAGEKFEGMVLMIAQVKKVAKVEAVIKKTIRF